MLWGHLFTAVIGNREGGKAGAGTWWGSGAGTSEQSSSRGWTFTEKRVCLRLTSDSKGRRKRHSSVSNGTLGEKCKRIPKSKKAKTNQQINGKNEICRSQKQSKLVKKWLNALVIRKSQCKTKVELLSAGQLLQIRRSLLSLCGLLKQCYSKCHRLSGL